MYDVPSILPQSVAIYVYVWWAHFSTDCFVNLYLISQNNLYNIA